MYTGTYEKGQADMEEDHDNNSILRVHIEMHMIADKYDVPTLAQVAAKLFKDSIARPTMDLLSINRPHQPTEHSVIWSREGFAQMQRRLPRNLRNLSGRHVSIVQSSVQRCSCS
jgi:hypothetical protein